MPSIAANGLDIGYDDIGGGPPLVMLHGAGTTGRQTYDALVPRLSGDFRILMPDARGHGRTRWDVARGFDTKLLVDDTLAFADALGLDAFHLAGYSMGGMTAMTVAARRPARILTLVAVGITSEREPRLSVARRLLDPDRVARDDPSWAADLARAHDPVQGTDAWRALLTAIVDDVAAQPLLAPADLRAIDAPALIACGDRDPLVPVGQAGALSRGVRDGRLLVAPGSGHDVVHERADLVGAAMTGFYRSTDAVARKRAGALTEVPR